MPRNKNRRRAVLSDGEDGFKDEPENTNEEAANVKEELEGSENDTVTSPEEPPEEDYEEILDDDDDEDEQVVTRRRRRRTTPSKHINSDDDFEDNESVVSDDFVEKLQEKRFIDSDDENGSEDYGGYGDARRRRKKRSRSRSVDLSAAPMKRRLRNNSGSNQEESGHESESSEDNIQREIAELYDSSPDPEPIKHKLRERAKIDYTIPQPITNDAQLEASALPASPAFPPSRRGRKPNSAKNEYRKLLFPTAGPFGGSDVISLFGPNIPPGGIPVPGLTNTNNLTAIGQNISDSDSSEEEIAPVNGDATITKKSLDKPKKSNGTLNHTKLITTSTKDPKSKPKSNLSDTDPLGVDMNIDFSAVGGLDNYIIQLKEMVTLPLAYPELYQNFGITPPRGVLFHGPPGTGKTLMARALAASCSTSDRKITFFMRKGADCLSKWVGEAERQLRLLFEEAKNQQPSIIFFDEIDGLAPVRSSKQEQIHASIVSTLLALMDGMDNRGQVIVIGATNRPDAVDPALRRPGRFDREFYFSLPNSSARAEILKIHTKKWNPPLSEEFVSQIASLTKGYGGADLRALCTEAALNSIQRKYPQIYMTNDKLAVVPSKVKVIAKDFIQALDKIVPSSARSTSSPSAPLPQHLKCLLEKPFQEVAEKLENLLPNTIQGGKKKKTQLDEALYLDPTIHDIDGGFARQEHLKSLQNSVICKPHLLISGEEGNGQQYISSAILNHLEGFQIQTIDMGYLYGDSTRTPEAAVIQAFIEARRHQPSIIFIPNVDIWYNVVPYSAKATLTGLLKSLRSNEKILLLAVSETPVENLDSDLRLTFGLINSSNNVVLHHPGYEERKEYFKRLKTTLLMKPYEFINDLANRPKRKLKKLKVVTEVTQQDVRTQKQKERQQEYEDNKLKNILKLKLATLMDLFKVRYKRFKKPVIDENLLYHLFYPEVLDNPLNNYEVLYVKSNDPEHKNMIQEIATGKYYYNLDLDVIEERLWNGYYSEPKQFLRDIKMVAQDCITSGDREKILKANEMLTNAQFGIDDIATPELVKACKEMRQREIQRQKQILEEHKNLQEQFENAAEPEQLPVGGEVEGEEALTKPVELPVTGDTPHIELNGNSEMRDIIPEVSIPEAEQTSEANVTHANDSVEDDHKVVEVAGNGGVTVEPSKIAEAEKVGDHNEAEADTRNTADADEFLAQEKVQHSPEHQEDSESEIEEGFEIDEHRQLILPANYENFFDKRVLEISSHCHVEKLEAIMAVLMKTIWDDRDKWNKTETMLNLYEAAKKIESA